MAAADPDHHQPQPGQHRRGKNELPERTGRPEVIEAERVRPNRQPEVMENHETLVSRVTQWAQSPLAQQPGAADGFVGGRKQQEQKNPALLHLIKTYLKIVHGF